MQNDANAQQLYVNSKKGPLIIGKHASSKQAKPQGASSITIIIIKLIKKKLVSLPSFASGKHCRFSTSHNQLIAHWS